jgi:hypothetical protein
MLKPIVIFWLFTFFILGNHLMAGSSLMTTLQKLDALPELNAEVTKALPSLLISDPSDRRIDQIAARTTHAFKVHGESKDFLVVVNPKKVTGMLFWKKAARLVIDGDRLKRIRNQNDSFTDDERNFIDALE